MSKKITWRDMLCCWQWWLTLVVSVPYTIALLPFMVLKGISEIVAELSEFSERFFAEAEFLLSRPLAKLVRWSRSHVIAQAKKEKTK